MNMQWWEKELQVLCCMHVMNDDACGMGQHILRESSQSNTYSLIVFAVSARPTLIPATVIPLSSKLARLCPG